jgi:PIN domain
MSRHPTIILIDSSILVAYYSARDNYHIQSRAFFEQCTSRLLTTASCITEVMWLLSPDWRVQNQFLSGVAKGVFECVPLIANDFVRIAELNRKLNVQGENFLLPDRVLNGVHGDRLRQLNLWKYTRRRLILSQEPVL